MARVNLLQGHLIRSTTRPYESELRHRSIKLDMLESRKSVLTGTCSDVCHYMVQ